MEVWLEGDSAGSALEGIINSKIDTPFIIWDTEKNFHSLSFAQPQRCRMRIEESVLKEIVVAAFKNETTGPFYFIWLKEGETATLKLPPYATKPLSIKMLKIGRP